MITEENRCEFIGQIMDVIEEVLDKSGFSFSNTPQLMREAGCSEEEIEENTAILYGENYDMFAEPIEDIMRAWGVLESEEKPSKKTWSLMIDGGLYASYPTVHAAFAERNRLVKEFLSCLYEDGTIDKYAVQDWTYGLELNQSMKFYVNEGNGKTFEIVRG